MTIEKDKPDPSGDFDNLRNKILTCTRCDLALTRHKVIFGEGNPKAKIFIIGEAPGGEEDILGRPFVGKSGQLLDKILAACGFNRNEHVFLSNIVRCRPPGNRIPTPLEASTCLPWLYEQIENIDPQLIVMLGATALKYLSGGKYKISQIHGNWIDFNNRPAMPVFHPSALLRDPSLKRPTWEDFKKIFHKYCELVDPKHYSPYINPIK